MKKNRITTRDIAKECNVSQTTVSMILSGREDVSFTEETVQLVKETAKKLGYIYKPRIIRKENSLKKTIMIMCPSLSTQYYTTLIQSITEYAQEKGLYTLTAYTTRSASIEEYYVRMAIDGDFRGIIYTYAPKALSLLNGISGKYPVILINDFNPELQIGLLELNSKKSGSLIAKHLLSLGHKRVAYLTTPLVETELPRVRRLQGMQEEFEKAGLPSEMISIFAVTEEQWKSYPVGNRHYEAGYRQTMHYFRHPSDITAFVGTNDIVAIGIMDALKKLGYRIPEDFSVCGFDNTLESSYSGISLTTIDHCIEEKGRAAVDMLLEQKKRMETEHSRRNAPVTRIEYQPLLIVRGSTGKIASKKEK